MRKSESQGSVWARLMLIGEVAPLELLSFVAANPDVLSHMIFGSVNAR